MNRKSVQFLKRVLQFLKRVLGSGLVFWCLDLSLGCLDLYLGCLDLYFGCLDLYFGSGLHLNVVRLFENACSCSVFCSVFASEHVWASCSALNVFGFLRWGCFVRCSGFGKGKSLNNAEEKRTYGFRERRCLTSKEPNLSFFGKYPTSSAGRANYSLEQH